MEVLKPTQELLSDAGGVAMRGLRAVTSRFRIESWSKLPASLDAPRPTAAIIEYPHKQEMVDPPDAA